jgi:hypothetical protein
MLTTYLILFALYAAMRCFVSFAPQPQRARRIVTRDMYG